MAKLFIVRHGQTEGNLGGIFCGHSETALTDTGIQQARALGRRLADTEFKAAYASDLSRAADTARHILAEHPSPPSLALDDRLREMHYGEWEGRPGSEIRAESPDLMREFFTGQRQAAPGGESIVQLRERMAAAARDAATAHAGENVLLVSHGNAIMALLAEMLSMAPEASWSFAIENTSLTRLHFSNSGKVTVLSVNETAHFEELARMNAGG